MYVPSQILDDNNSTVLKQVQAAVQWYVNGSVTIEVDVCSTYWYTLLGTPGYMLYIVNI